jgi:S1-C subfamily serine protease
VLLLPGDVGSPDPALADYLLLTEERSLPPGGRLGLRLDPEDGGVVIGGIDAQGAAAAAGVREGDRVVAVDGAAVRLPGDVRVALWERKPGDVVILELRRGEPDAAREEIALPVTLR